jgi:hypothetical protein
VPGAVGAAGVVAHHANRLEAHLLVTADGSRICGLGVDRDSMMTEVACDVSREGADGIGAEPAILCVLAECDVDPHMSVFGLGFLPILNETDQLTIGFDREAVDIVVLEVLGDALEGGVRPPQGDARRLEHPDDTRQVVGRHGPQLYEITDDFHGRILSAGKLGDERVRR